MTTFSNALKALTVAAAASIVLAGAGKLAIAVVKSGGREAVDTDFRYLYASGLAWRSGLNPYDLDEFYRASPFKLDCSFAYAPTFAPFAIPLSMLPVEPAKVVLRAINVMSAVAIAFMLWAAASRMLPRDRGWGVSVLVPALVAAMPLAAPSTSINLLLGQTSTIAVALLCGAWWCRELNRPIAAGVLAGFATFKPSVAVFAMLLLLLDRNWRLIASLAITALVLGALPLFQQGPVTLVKTWLAAMRAYTEFEQNRPSNPNSYGLGSVFWDLGLSPSLTPPLAVAGFVWSLFRRKALGSFGVFAFSLALPVLLIRSHNYDSIALMPLITFALVVSAGASAAVFLLTLGLTFFTLLPGNVVTSLAARGIPLPTRFRDLTELALLAGAILMVEVGLASPRPNDQSKHASEV